MRRVFVFTYKNCYGDTGGGHGVVYRLYRINKKYKLFDDAYFVFNDRIIHNEEEPGKFSLFISEGISPIKKKLPGIFFVGRRCISCIKQIGKLYVLNKKFKFEDDDIFIFHDFYIAQAFVKFFHFSKTIYVYHCQGSLYSEWSSMAGKESSLLEWYLNCEFKSILRKIKVLCFPSKGAKESLIESCPEVMNDLNIVDTAILYNGVNCEIENLEETPDWYNSISKKEDVLKFLTVATLNTAKAVERIPEFLGEIKKRGLKFQWILIGNGSKKDDVDTEITKYNIVDNTIWCKDYVSHEIILKVMSLTDFYILFHKYSIFDLSTLEAMGLGNIPILTRVGGNKEVIINNNGIFVEQFNDISEFEKLIADESLIKKLKKQNVEIVETKYSEYTFLKGYFDLCSKL